MPALSAIGIAKSFDGTDVLADATFTVPPSSIAAVVGGNGSGKTTLMKILAGVHPPDQGAIRLDDKPLVLDHPRAALAHGIAMVYQEDAVCDDLSVADNILLGHTTRATRNGYLGFVRAGQRRAQARRALKEIGLAAVSDDAYTPGLSGGQRKTIALARALLHRPRVLILDEPTNSLGVAEQRHLLTLVKELRSKGVTVLYVSHKMTEVRDAATCLIVVADGTARLVDAPHDLTDEKLSRLMSGD